MSETPSTTSTTFSYKPFHRSDEIRLLVLQPATTSSAQICCSLVHTSLFYCDNEIIDHYTALSYVWGDATDTRNIWIDGSSVRVTVNLFNALRDIRDSTRELSLWADAVCINQTDDYEKAQQVSMMGAIYATASHTIIYLGADDPGIEPVLNLSDPALSTHAKEVILSSPWFGRIWVFQELVLSQDPWVQSSTKRWRWDKMCDFLEQREQDESFYSGNAIQREKLPSSPSLDISPWVEGVVANGEKSKNPTLGLVAQMRRARRDYQSGSNTKMLDLLQPRRALGVSDPRDMIWAHKGFAADGDDAAYHVDYEKISCAKLYINLALLYLNLLGTSDLFFHVGNPGAPSLIENLPSWVPDWTVPSESYGPYSNLPQPVTKRLHSRKGYPCPIELKPIFIENPPIIAETGCGQDLLVFRSGVLSQDTIPHERKAAMTARFEALASLLRRGGLGGTGKDPPIEIEIFCQRAYDEWRSIIENDDLLYPLSVYEETSRIHHSACILSDFFQSVSRHRYERGTANRHVTRKDFFDSMGSAGVEGWLIAYFVPDFDTSFIEDRVLARFSSGTLA